MRDPALLRDRVGYPANSTGSLPKNLVEMAPTVDLTYAGPLGHRTINSRSVNAPFVVWIRAM